MSQTKMHPAYLRTFVLLHLPTARTIQLTKRSKPPNTQNILRRIQICSVHKNIFLSSKINDIARLESHKTISPMGGAGKHSSLRWWRSFPTVFPPRVNSFSLGTIPARPVRLSCKENYVTRPRKPNGFLPEILRASQLPRRMQREARVRERTLSNATSPAADSPPACTRKGQKKRKRKARL